MRFAIIFMLIISMNVLNAQAADEAELPLVEKWRPTISKLFGEEFTIKLLGKMPEKKEGDLIALPKIPVIQDDAKSAEVYNKKPDKVILKKEEEEKYHYNFLYELYEVTRQVRPTEEDFRKMMNTLSQGATREGVYRALVLDSVYAQLESTDRPIKEPAQEFATYFYATYVNKKLSSENFKSLNMYSLKRLMAEKALEIIDAFGDNREDMEKWYAVLSSDLASRFPQHWSNKMRKNPSKALHKNWASKAPVQHIKSETVIKLHTAFNSLM